MSERLDAVTVRESNDKSYFTKIGVAFPSRNGPGYTLLLDAVPASADGQYKILLMPPRDQSAGRGSGNGGRQRRELDDDVPF